MPDRHTGFIFSSLDKTVEILDFSTKSAPQATVVVVTYKRNQQLLECLASLARQSYKNFETIVIDNGKNEAVHAGLSKYNVRHILLKKNYGLSIGRNIGIEYARSDIVIFLDDDALAGPNLVKSHVEAHQELNIVGLRGKAIGKTRTIYNDLQQHYDLGEEIRLCVLPADNDVIKEKLFRANCFCHSASIFRKKCIERVGAYRETFKMAQDYDLWLRIAEEFDVSNIEEPLCKWRANPCSITISKKAEQDLYAQLAYSLAIQRQVFGQDKLGYKPPGEQFRLLRRKLVAGYFAKKRIVSNKYLMCAEKYPFKGLGRWDRKTAIKYLLKSLLNNPLNFGAWFYIAHRIARKIKNTFESLLSKVQRSSSHVARRLE